MATKLTDYDGGLREMRIDTLCNWPVSENTPESFIKTVYIPAEKPIIDGFDPAWTSGFFEALKTGGKTDEQNPDRVPTYSEAPCERPGGPGNISVSIDSVGINTTTESNKKTVEIAWIGDRNIISLRVLQDNKELRSTAFGSGAQKSGKERVSLSLLNGSSVITVEVIDQYGFKYTESKTVIANENWTQWTESGTTPTNDTTLKINVINPRGGNINLYEGTTFNLRFSVDIATANREIQVLVDNTSIQNATAWDMFVIPVWTAGLTPGKHTLKIIAIDGNFKKIEQSITLTILNR